VEQSLVIVELDAPGGTRYRMLEPIRQYALGRLQGGGEEEPVRERHAAYYSSLAERAEQELEGPRQAEWLDRLERENANLRTALLWTTGRTGEAGLRLAVALRRFWSVRGHLEEGRWWLELALASCPATPPSLRAKALGGLGEMALERGERGPAEELFKRAWNWVGFRETL
jgi:predicted ATPase